MSDHQAERFFAKLYDGQNGVLELRTFAHDSEPQDRHKQANRLRTFISVKDGRFDFSPVERFLKETERQQFGAFFGVALRTQASLKTHKGDAAHCQTLPALFVDADFKHLGEAKTRQRIEDCSFKPLIIVGSGGGLHPYWPLAFPIPLQASGGMAKAKSQLQRLAEVLAGDETVLDEDVSEPVRVLRIPGSFNFKKEYDKPRPVVLELLRDDDEPHQPATSAGLDMFGAAE